MFASANGDTSVGGRRATPFPEATEMLLPALEWAPAPGMGGRFHCCGATQQSETPASFPAGGTSVPRTSSNPGPTSRPGSAAAQKKWLTSNRAVLYALFVIIGRQYPSTVKRDNSNP